MKEEHDKNEIPYAKWLLITQYYLPEIGAPQVRLHNFALELNRHGGEVEVITAMPNYPIGVIAESYRGLWRTTEELDGVTVRRVWIYTANGKSFCKRIFNYLSFSVGAILEILFIPRPDIVFVEAQPLSLGFAAVLMKWLRGVPYIYNVPDLQVDVAYQLGFVKNKHFLNLALTLEKFFMRHSLKVSTVTRNFIEVIERRKIPRKQITFLPNGANADSFYPARPDENLIKKWNLHDKKVFLYVGTHAFYHGLDVLIAAAKLLQVNTEIIFLVIGNGPERARLEQIANESELQNIIWEQFPPIELNRVYSIAYASIVTLRNIPVAQGMRPAKIFPSLSCGVPVIFTGTGETAELLINHQCGITVPPEIPEQLADAISFLSANTKRRNELGKAGRKLVETDYNWKVIVNNWLLEIQKV